MNNARIKYLESLLPMSEDKLEKKYWKGFEKYATYTGGGNLPMARIKKLGH